MIEPQEANVRHCFLEACKALHVEGVEPTTENMREALAYHFELDEEAGWVRATSPTGTVYTFDLNTVEHVTCVEPATHVVWLVWLILMSLAGLHKEMNRLSQEKSPDYIRTFSDGQATHRKSVKSMFFQE